VDAASFPDGARVAYEHTHTFVHIRCVAKILKPWPVSLSTFFH